MYMIDYFHLAGGTETHLAYLATMLDKNKFKCFIVVFDLEETTLIRRIRISGVPVIHVSVGRYYTYNAIKQAFALSKFIKENNIDIVQTFHFKSDFYGALVAHLSGVKHIISSKRDLGDLKKEWHLFLNRRVNRFFDGCIVAADAVGKVVIKKENISQNKIKTIYNGVDTKRFFPPNEVTIIESRKRLGLSASDFVVGMVAWFRPEKNYNIFFKAIDKIKESIKVLKVVIVGVGPLFDYYVKYSKDRELSKQVIFAGKTDDVTKYLKVFDVACLIPGGNEGFSNSIIEKMAMGLPLVVSDVGGNAEAVLDNYNGIVIPPNDVDALANAIIYLYNNRGKRKNMGILSRQLVEEHFTLENMIKNHEDYYCDLVEHK